MASTTAQRVSLLTIGVLSATSRVSAAEPGWSSTGSMAEARAGHTATLLPSGHVLIAGGRKATEEYQLTETAELYDIQTGTFTATGPMALPRSGHTASVLPSGEVLIVGGVSGEPCQGSAPCIAELYDPQTGTFSSTGSLALHSRFNRDPGHTASVLGSGEVLVVDDGFANLYDPSSGTFSSAAPLPEGFTGSHGGRAATVLASGAVLVVGGYTIGGKGSYAWPLAMLFDPVTASFSTTASMNEARSGATLTVLESADVLIVGGVSTSAEAIASVERYDVKASSFSLTGTMVSPRQGHSASLLQDGAVLVAGGAPCLADAANACEPHASVELYDVTAGEFVEAPPMSSLRARHTATVLPSGNVLVVGGTNADWVSQTTAEIYDPTTTAGAGGGAGGHASAGQGGGARSGEAGAGGASADAAFEPAGGCACSAGRSGGDAGAWWLSLGLICACRLRRREGRAVRSLVITILCALVVIGCDDAESGATGGGGTGAGGAGASSATGSGGAAPTVQFSPCPLVDTELLGPPPSGPLPYRFDEGLSPINESLAFADQIPAMSTAMAECGTLPVPADWNDPAKGTIDVFVQRYPAAVQPATGQLWMLQGGPGYPGSTMAPLAFLLASQNPTLDIYLPDHRGTGRSAFADCTASNYAACATEIPHLSGLTTTGAARDLAALIDATATGADVFVYGVSYGTYWAQRYLHIRPEQPTAVVLDSVVPVVFDFAEFDRNFDDKAHAVLELCATDATCSAKLGGDPIARAREVIDAPDSPCALLPMPQLYFGGLVGGDFFDRLLLPAAIYRSLRCDPGDQEWFEAVAAYHEWYAAPSWAGFSSTLQRNVMYSEMWQSDASVDEILAARQDMIAFDLSAYWAIAASKWPHYPRDEYYGKWPSTPAPILILQGGLDARTPYGDVASAQYSGANQYYVELPTAAHGLIDALISPMADLTSVGCGTQIIQSFLANPSHPPDTSCIAAMAPIDFANPPPEWLALVGIDDLWEN